MINSIVDLFQSITIICGAIVLYTQIKFNQEVLKKFQLQIEINAKQAQLNSFLMERKK